MCWGISAITFGAAVLLGVGEVTKTSVFVAVLGVLWLVAGVVNWRRKNG